MKNTDETANLTMKNKNRIIIIIISKLFDIICTILGGPILFLIDDIHFLDLHSLLLLKHLWDHNNYLTIICTSETFGGDHIDNYEKYVDERNNNDINSTWKDCDSEYEIEKNENNKYEKYEKNENETFYENENLNSDFEIFEYFKDMDINCNRFIDIKLQPLDRCAISGNNIYIYVCIYLNTYAYV
jgi:hypothetical protein